MKVLEKIMTFDEIREKNDKEEIWWGMNEYVYISLK